MEPAEEDAPVAEEMEEPAPERSERRPPRQPVKRHHWIVRAAH